MGDQLSCNRLLFQCRNRLGGSCWRLTQQLQLALKLLGELAQLLAAWIAAGCAQPVDPAHEITAGLLLAQGIAFPQQGRQAAAQPHRPQLPCPQ